VRQISGQPLLLFLCEMPDVITALELIDGSTRYFSDVVTSVERTESRSVIGVLVRVS
jgi:hypothetical protein